MTGGIGSAGGDVAIVTHRGNILNRPANKENQTRPVPAVLILH
jgi:hypothetical protein